MHEIAVFYMGHAGSAAVVETCRKLGIHASRAYDRLYPEQAGYKYIVSLVRDPVARNVQEFSAGGRQGTAKDLMEQFLSWDGHDRPLTWFQLHFGPELGVDAYELPFDRKRGWSLYVVGAESLYEARSRRILVIRAEDWTEQWVLALEALLETDLGVKEGFEVPTPIDTVPAKLRRMKLPGEYLDRMYESEYAKHFYYAKEIAAFRERWSGGK